MRKNDILQEKYDLFMEEKRNEIDEITSTFVVEVPTKQHDRADIREAKLKEINNLEYYDVFQKVEDNGEEKIGARNQHQQN